MKNYIIGLKPLDSSALPKDTASRRREAARLSMEEGAAAKRRIESFLEENGLMDQVKHIGEPMLLPALLICCTEEAAARLKSAGIEGVESISEDLPVQVNDPADSKSNAARPRRNRGPGF